MRRRSLMGWGVVEDGYTLWWNPSLRLMKQWFSRGGGKWKRRFVRMPHYMAPDR